MQSSADDEPDMLHILKAQEEKLVTSIGQFREQLQHIDLVEAKQNPGNINLHPLHEVLLALWTPPISDYVDVIGSTNSIVMQFLILINLIKVPTANYGFKHVRYVTQPLAMLQYWVRSTILMELGRQIWQKNAEPVTNQ